MPKPYSELVASILENSNSLISIDISEKELGSRGCTKLGAALKKNRYLQELLVCENDITDQGATSILQGILDNPKTKLKKLDFAANEITIAVDDLITQVKDKGVHIILEDNPYEAAKKKKKSSSSSSSSHKEKRKTKKRKHIKRSDNSNSKLVVDAEESSTTEEQSAVIDSRRKILEYRISALAAKEYEYRNQIEELESRVKELTRGNSAINVLFSKSKNQKSKTAMTVGTKSIIITQALVDGGGSANVYSCIVDGWLVVMKELATAQMSQNSIDRFSREIRILELLPPHQNIVRYLFHDVKDHQIRLFMTHYDGSLGQHLRMVKEAEESISPKNVFSILLGIIKGIEFLHGQNIMHRDLKCDNIFVLYGERKEILLCAIGDFDCANQVSNTKTVLGTPAWMAPEVMTANDADAQYGFPCDVYGFGMIIFELITLKPPFYDLNPMQTIKAVSTGEKPRLPPLSPEYDTLLEIMQECIEFDPLDRPTPRQLRDTLALGMANTV